MGLRESAGDRIAHLVDKVAHVFDSLAARRDGASTALPNSWTVLCTLRLGLSLV